MKIDVFSEKQAFPLIILFTLILLTLFVVSNAAEGEFGRVFTTVPFYLVLALFLSPVVFWGVMHTAVTSAQLVIRFGLVPTQKIGIDIKAIRTVERTAIKWPRDFHWVGITHHKKNGMTGCFVRYGKGIKLTTEDGIFFIGSARPEQLAAAIQGLKKKNT